MTTAQPAHLTVEAHRVVFAGSVDPRWHASIEVAATWDHAASGVLPRTAPLDRLLPTPDEFAVIGVSRDRGDVMVEVRAGPLARNVDELLLAAHYLRALGLDPVPVDAPPEFPIAAARPRQGEDRLVLAAARTAPGRAFVACASAAVTTSEEDLSRMIQSVSSLRIEGRPEGVRAEPLRAYEFVSPAAFVAQAPAGYMPRELLGAAGRTLQLELDDRDEIRRRTLTFAAFAEDQFGSADAVLAAYRSTLEKRNLGCDLSLELVSLSGHRKRVLEHSEQARALAAQGHVDVRAAIGRIDDAWILIAALGPSARLDPAGHIVHLAAYDVAVRELRTKHRPLGEPGDAPASVKLT